MDFLIERPRLLFVFLSFAAVGFILAVAWFFYYPVPWLARKWRAKETQPEERACACLDECRSPCC